MAYTTDDFRRVDPRDINFALSYPFAVPGGSYVYVDGHAMALADTASSDMMAWIVHHRGIQRTLGDVVHRTAHADMALDRLTPIVAAGSNASPMQLLRKFQQRRDIIVPCLKMPVRDWTVTYARHIAPYGSIPASLERAPGETTQLFVNFLDAEAMDGMHGTESIGTYYQLAEVSLPEADSAPWASGMKAHAYTSHTGHLPFRPGGLETSDRRFAPRSQWQIQDIVIDLLGEDVSVMEFIARNMSDEAVRLQRERRLIDADI
ncbi:hypothetical protein [Aquisalinus flavus]|uniref:Uncharacterized protein n=1 Tax=Aquisalinus flavus TaxID=1526572 RepID=A0A8J2V7A6_9PROT|nr:hypothetical protein [Aquisalinus flavus]MBD0425320.1 hypothetical protein [Aquisalinus flavus]UNE49028.1 hypothetical protein FF099_13700 [Aquisalinus flavus]GGD17013.1 hypothetical protein GCM10011342_27230 [Aquisalinus flavus]